MRWALTNWISRGEVGVIEAVDALGHGCVRRTI